MTQWGNKNAAAHLTSGFEILYWPSRDGTQSLGSAMSPSKYFLHDNGL